MPSCQELQNKISQLKDLKQKFEASYADFQKQIEIAPDDETAKRLALDKVSPYRDEIEAILSWFEENFPERKIKAQWTKFYQEVIKKAIPNYKIPDFSNIKIPEHQEGFDWTIIMDKNLTYEQIKEVCEASFLCEFIIDPQEIDLTQEERSPQKDGSYAIHLRNREEADEENADMSANQIKEQQMKTLTLLERMTLELYYWWSNNGKHLDIENVTICSGSRCLDGFVPHAFCSGGWFLVFWRNPDNADGNLRARLAV